MLSSAKFVTSPTPEAAGRDGSRRQRTTAIAALCLGAALAYFYAVWYPRTGDMAPDSVYGYGFAIAGTALLVAVGLGYTVRKRLRQHWSGRLNTMLAWHALGALLGLLLILMHTAGNFNPRSGTYALYGLLAVTMSGIVGRALDRLSPWLAARARGASRGDPRRGAPATQTTMQREQFSLQLMRTWRQLHTLLSVVFLGLLVWHLVYAATLLMQAR
jgi:hypothetical protein